MAVGKPPYVWTPEIEDELLGRIAAGEAVADICGIDRDDWLPGMRTFYKRLHEDADFAQQYARAREIQAHGEADKILSIADMATPENVQVARLQSDARQWRASKMAPKVYGDRSVVEGPGPNGEHTVNTPEASPKEVARRLAFLLASGIEQKD